MASKEDYNGSSKICFDVNLALENVTNFFDLFKVKKFSDTHPDMRLE
jgi:hypothetical protein